MSKLMLEVPQELKTILERYPDIGWESVAANALWNLARKVQIVEGIASRSALTETAAVAIGREVKAGVRRRYAKATR